ncbi:amidohydrolase family protein [Roseiarcaceae bacterium H3SJ34-1]|uniref:amidohydrolase family protein n=1 Tax=Terripilifer ovatus TaxID=3032367 RepID=UPI003AB96B5E|nr:amidohydrolase family protein [Roseiarcaceae bacterium H3SJ34-1]
MVSSKANPVIALEEHYWDAELVAQLSGAEGTRSKDLLAKLHDLSEIRLREMDEAGIDIQVLSHGAPSGQKLPPDIAADLTRRVNDRLAEAIARHPTRFAGFAALPTVVPDAAADELERCVRDLKFKGAMIHGLTNGKFIDEKQFWPIFERAAALNVPIYLHPSFPHPQVMEAYYNDYAKDFPMVIRAAWGYTVEAATQAIRLILSGVFQAHPKLQIVLGHMGETLPFALWRINQALARPGHQTLNFRQTFCDHFHVTTSGNFSTPALVCTMMELGADRIMFSVDWPFVANPPAMEWMRTLQISETDKQKIFGGNARNLLRL